MLFTKHINLGYQSHPYIPIEMKLVASNNYCFDLRIILKMEAGNKLMMEESNLKTLAFDWTFIQVLSLHTSPTARL